jgi:r-opsin
MTIIHPHWSQYPPVNPLVGHFFGLIFFFLWIMSFLGNGCVIYIFLKVKSLRTPVRNAKFSPKIILKYSTSN